MKILKVERHIDKSITKEPASSLDFHISLVQIDYDIFRHGEKILKNILRKFSVNFINTCVCVYVCI